MMRGNITEYLMDLFRVMLNLPLPVNPPGKAALVCAWVWGKDIQGSTYFPGSRCCVSGHSGTHSDRERQGITGSPDRIFFKNNGRR
jgi:hypothetical protein